MTGVTQDFSFGVIFRVYFRLCPTALSPPWRAGGTDSWGRTCRVRGSVFLEAGALPIAPGGTGDPHIGRRLPSPLAWPAAPSRAVSPPDPEPPGAGVHHGSSVRVPRVPEAADHRGGRLLHAGRPALLVGRLQPL